MKSVGWLSLLIVLGMSLFVAFLSNQITLFQLLVIVPACIGARALVGILYELELMNRER